MEAERVIKYRLGSYAGVTALVGSGSASRIYPSVAEQLVVRPFIVYSRVGARYPQGVHSASGLCYATVLVTCIADTADGALELGRQVRAALNRYGWAIAGALIDGVLVYDITVGEGETTGYDDELQLHVHSCPYIVFHQEGITP